MIIAILLIYILIQINAPAWCFVLAGLIVVLNLTDYILNLITRKLKNLNDELERNQKLEELSGR